MNKRIKIPYKWINPIRATDDEEIRIRKLSDAAELIKQAYSFNTTQVLYVMGNLYDFIQKTYPENVKFISKEKMK